MRRIIGLALTLVTTTSPLFAQRSGRPSGLREVRDGGSAGLTVVVAQPLGDFSRTGDVAAGLTGFVVVGLDRSASVGLRIDGSYLVYDSYYRSNAFPRHRRSARSPSDRRSLSDAARSGPMGSRRWGARSSGRL